MALFQQTVIDKYLTSVNREKINAAYEQFKLTFLNPSIQENIRNSKEEQYQEGFLRDLFVNILGYTLNPAENYNLTTEYKNVKDSKKADGAILINGNVKAVIELKGTDTTDLDKIEPQAFGYKNNQPECTYIIISNFEKLRLYIDNAVEHIAFNLFTLDLKQFTLLYTCLACENMLADLPKKLKEASVSEEDKITKELYKDYSLFKQVLFQNMVERNTTYDELALFNRSQKLLDRFLFIFFAEDRSLLPPNSMRKILQQWKQLKELDEDIPLYNRFKKYFGYMNTGFKGKNDEVFAYNGGLFKADEVLDSIEIDDDILYDHTFKLSQYDYASEVDVNILGHIFENSLNEMEEIKARIEGKAVDKSKTKRKKDGVFYTPKYITKYIVENTVGKLCDEKKHELGMVEEEYLTERKRNISTKKPLIEKLEAYREWLLHITVCDPACGSGAFLNQALDYLIREHRYIDELKAKITGFDLVFEDVENSILENNLYGVDLNEESVEIAKLSLWLRTARQKRKLNSLNNNIKCGNSLIDDPAIAGNKAFNWEMEFSHVFAKGGFDVVIGNPPWGAHIKRDEKEYLDRCLPFVNKKHNDTYIYFTFCMLNLLKRNGYLGLIIPNTWMLINSAKEVRLEILKYHLIEITDYGDGVFEDVTTESSTLILKKFADPINYVISIRKKGNKTKHTNIIDKNEWIQHYEGKILIDLSQKITTLIKKAKENSLAFDEIADIIWGIKPYQIGHGTPPQTKEMLEKRVYHSTLQINTYWKPLVTGSNVNRYSLEKNKIEYILYGINLMYPSNIEKIISPKILLRQTSDSLRCVIDTEGFYPQNSLFIITLKSNSLVLEYLLVILNSKLFEFIYKILNPQENKTFAEIKPSVIKQLPIKIISPIEQQPFVAKGHQMLILNQELQQQSEKFLRSLTRHFGMEDFSSKLYNWHLLTYKQFLAELKKMKINLSLNREAEWEAFFLTEKQKLEMLQQQINQTDREIDQMLYILYGLTEEEIAIIEKK